MQKTNIGHGFGDDLAVKFEHEPQNSVGSGMGWPHVDDHLFPDVVARLLSSLFPQFCIGRDHARHWIRIFNFARGKGHGDGVGFMLATGLAGASQKGRNCPRVWPHRAG